MEDPGGDQPAGYVGGDQVNDEAIQSEDTVVPALGQRAGASRRVLVEVGRSIVQGGLEKASLSFRQLSLQFQSLDAR